MIYKIHSLYKYLFCRYSKKEHGGATNWFPPKPIIVKYSVYENQLQNSILPYDSKEFRYVNGIIKNLVAKKQPVAIVNSSLSGMFQLISYGKYNAKFLFGGSNIYDDILLSQYLHSYGSHSAQYNVDDLTLQAVRNRQTLICGSASQFIQKILSLLGHKSRLVTSLREDGFNSYDNGHTLLEILSAKGEWQLFDPGYGGWLSYRGEYVSAISLNRLILEGKEFAFEPIWQARHFSNFHGSDNFNLLFDLESKWFFPTQIENWYRKVFKIIGIEAENGIFKFMTETQTEKKLVEEYVPNYKGLNYTDFMTQFYSNNAI